MTASLRDSFRELGQHIRTEHRNVNFNRSRKTQGLDKESTVDIITPAQVQSVVMEMKEQSHATLHQLRLMQQAFIGVHGRNNINTFLSLTGALNIIIKELSGQNAALQLAAANCCCNLALGNDKQCSLLTKASAPYLILYLQGTNTQLVDICAWTIGNLAASGPKAWSVLSGQGACLKLADLLLSSDIDVVHSGIYALTFYLKTGGNNTDSGELQSIATNAVPLLKTNLNVCWLLFLLSCHSACDDILNGGILIPTIVEILSLSAHRGANLTMVTALLRVLGNLCGTEDGRGAKALLDYIHQVAPAMWEMVKSPHEHLRREVVWLFGNLINHPREDVRNRVAQLQLREQLEVNLPQLQMDNKVQKNDHIIF